MVDHKRLLSELGIWTDIERIMESGRIMDSGRILILGDFGAFILHGIVQN